MLLEELFEQPNEALNLSPKARRLGAAALIGGSLALGNPKTTSSSEPSYTAPIAVAMDQIPGQPPNYKRDIVKQNDWDNFRNALNSFNIPAKLKYIYSQIFAAEGGLKRDGSRVVAGITGGILKSAQKANIVDPKIKHQKELNPEEIVSIYNFYFDRVLQNAGGKAALTNIDTPTGSAIADSLFRYGPGGGSYIVQKALRDVLSDISPRNKEKLGIGGVDFERALSKKVVDANILNLVEILTHNGFGDELRSKIAEYRIDYPGKLGGDVTRANYFRN